MNLKLNKTIVIIDDDKDLSEVVKGQLELEGYSVLVANDGIQGLEIVKKQKPDLIILDIMMPNTDGIQVGEQLKASSELREIPIIFLTGLKSKSDQEFQQDDSANIVMPKPYEPTDLLRQVRQLLEK